MGDGKPEIVLIGDTVNTTARIEQASRELDRTAFARRDERRQRARIHA